MESPSKEAANQTEKRPSRSSGRAFLMAALVWIIILGALAAWTAWVADERGQNVATGAGTIEAVPNETDSPDVNDNEATARDAQQQRQHDRSELELAAIESIADVYDGSPPAPPGGLLERPGDVSPGAAVLDEDAPEPWRRHATPFLPDGSPLITLVILDLGQSGIATETAIQRLPQEVVLAFSPYAPDLDRWIPEARAAGHEVLMMVPMEPVTYPRDDPGPQTLLTSLTVEDNLSRLEWILARTHSYVGVVSSMGSRMTTSREALEPVMAALNDRGLIFLDSRTAVNSVASEVGANLGVPVAVNHRFIDGTASRDAIDMRLTELEETARRDGHAIGLASPFPITFERLAAWIPRLEERGLRLAPLSATAVEEETLIARP